MNERTQPRPDHLRPEQRARLESALRGERVSREPRPQLHTSRVSPQPANPDTQSRQPKNLSKNSGDLRQPTYDEQREKFKDIHPLAYKLGCGVVSWHVGFAVGTTAVFVGIPTAFKEIGHQVPFVGHAVPTPAMGEVAGQVKDQMIDGGTITERWVWHHITGDDNE